MEIKKDNVFKRNLKRIGAVAVVCVVALAIALTIAFSIPGEEVDVSTTMPEFGLPMNNAQIIKDYSDTRLQHVEGAKRYEIHLSVDFSSDDNTVMAVSDGIVKSVKDNTLDGKVVTIEHSDGFVSVYASLGEETDVKEGDRVVKGQVIGSASDSSGYESGFNCNHLHFTLMHNGTEVDPNNYLNLQNK